MGTLFDRPFADETLELTLIDSIPEGVPEATVISPPASSGSRFVAAHVSVKARPAELLYAPRGELRFPRSSKLRSSMAERGH